MSVTLILRKTKNGDDIDAPVATEETFVQFWLPIAEKKSLKFITAMHSGYEINSENFGDVFKELKLMKDAFITEVGLSDDHKKFFMKRIDYIIENIELEFDNPDVEGFVG